MLITATKTKFETANQPTNQTTHPQYNRTWFVIDVL